MMTYQLMWKERWCSKRCETEDSWWEYGGRMSVLVCCGRIVYPGAMMTWDVAQWLRGWPVEDGSVVVGGRIKGGRGSLGALM
jgi:hypothetical protein